MLTSSKRLFSAVLKSPYVKLQAPSMSRAFTQWQDPKNRFGKKNPENSNDLPPNLNERYSQQQVQQEYPTPEDYIKLQPSLSEFLQKIYNITGLTIGSYLGASYLLSGTALALTNPGMMVIGGLLTSLGGVFAFNAIPQQVTEHKLPDGKVTYTTSNPTSRLAAFAAIIAGNTIALTPLVAVLNAMSPTIVPAACVGALLIMGGSSLYAMKQPIGKFTAWRSGLYGGLLGLIGINFLSLASFAIWGPNLFYLMALKVDTYVGIGLFTAFNIFDTHQAIEDYNMGNTDHLRHVINFYMNFVNLFIRLARIISEYYNNQ
jgi:FtsH-binding integral membrane protein